MLAAGTRLGTYEILGPLGAGGMGEVYRARDLRLGRDIALKVLPAEVAGDADRLARFEREARTVAALNHPAIVVLHSIDEAGGTRFLTMELVEGRSLDAEVADGALATARVVAIGLALAEALQVAHERGIVHRDLKPANVMLTPDDRVKVLDFGLAKATPTGPGGDESQDTTESLSLSATGHVVGTVPYMSPEQLRGEPVDARTDLFALGVLLYELASGARPFTGWTVADLTSAILRDPPPPLPAPVGAGDLEAVIFRCLRKRPEERFASAAEVGGRLREVKRRLESGEGAAREPSGATATAMQRSVAVLPFRDLQGRPENADLGLGLADATITELTLVRSLVVRPTSTILRYQDRRLEPQGIAAELAVDAIVDGSFQRAGDRLRVTVQMISRHDGRSLWATKIDTSLEDVFRMQDEVSRRIAAALDVELTPAEDRRLLNAARPAPAGEAYAAYMGGKRHLYRGTLADVNAAIECFDRACAIDPTFAPAWAGLGDAYARMAFEHAPEGDGYVRAQAMCDRALALDPALPEARYLRGRLRWNPLAGFDHVDAIRDAAGALQGRPGLTEARYLLGLVLFHVGLLDEASGEFEQLLAADPHDTYSRVHVGTVRMHQGRWEEARAVAAETVGTSHALWSSGLLAQCQLRLGDVDGAGRTVERLGRQSPEYSQRHSLGGLVAALRGDAALARRGIERTTRHRRDFGHYHHAQYDVACIHAVLGDLDHAVEWLGDAARNGYPCPPFFAVDPLLRPLHGHAGYEGLLADLDEECEGYRRLWSEVTPAAVPATRAIPASAAPSRIVPPASAPDPPSIA